MVHHSSGNLYGIRFGDWKYIDGLGSGGFTYPTRIPSESGGPTGQLYRISSDKEEQENLFLNYPEKVEELQKLLNNVSEKE